MRIVFMGSPALAVPVLETLLHAGHDVACVYTVPPRKAGRGKQLRESPVHEYARAQGLEVRTPHSLSDPQTQAEFLAHKAELALVIAYGLLLPEALLTAPQYGCLNLHGSALPRWRGAAPVQRAIMAGDPMTALQIMQMEAGLDTGPIMLSESLSISPTDTAGDLFARMGQIGGGLAIRAIAALQTKDAVFTPQAELGVFYAHKISADEARIDWNQPSATVRNQIHGLSPAPGAWSLMPDGSRLKILRAAQEDAKGPCGCVLEPGLIACQSGALRLLELQKPGKRALSGPDFWRGSGLPNGSILR